MKTMSSVQAQNNFGELLDTAQREPVTITRRGRTVAFLVSPQDMEDLTDARRKREQALTDFETFFRRADAKLGADAKDLTDADVNRMVNELR